MEAAITTVGGAILSASFQVLFDKLGSHDVLKYAREGDVRDELKKWEDMLKKIYLVLDDAEEKKTADPSVKMWLRGLRDLAYDVEDVLDEFATHQALRKLEDQPLPEASTSKMKKFMPTCCGKLKLSTFKLNAEMISKIKKMTERLDDIMKAKNELHLAEGSKGRSNQIRERATTILIEKTEIYGRDNEEKEVIEILQAKACGAKLSVIPLVGMGGLGKTTLAQLVYQNPSLDFDFKAWVSVGEDFDVHKITVSILEPKGDDQNKDLNWHQIKLKEKLSMKKFLVVLDDVWTENYILWDKLSLPLKYGAPGSTVIITTRNKDVALMMGTSPPYDLKNLSDDACLSVFAQHALGATDFDDHMDLKEIGEEIVRRCDGLPLAAKALGGLLRGRPDSEVWMDILRSEIWDFPEDRSSILPALRLSYLHLPSYLKQCFAYCGIFPKGYEFNKSELVSLWLAEGILRDLKKNKKMEEVGSRYFDDLLARSFFQQSGSSESRYVMHDLMNDLARYVSSEMCFQLGDELEDEESYTMIRHSSFIRHEFDNWQKFDVFLKMKKLRTLVAMPIMRERSGSRYCLTTKVLNELVPELKCLRVLSLAGYQFDDLPSNIGASKLLRYLNFSSTAIERLPESVVELINLQTLILHGCQELTMLPIGIGNLINLYCLDISCCAKLTELPSGVVDLINLHYLDISGCKELKKLPLGVDNLTNLQCLDVRDAQEMPPKIGNLRNLQTLTKFIVGKDSGLKLTELKKLSKLKGKLCIEGLQNVIDIRDAEFTDIKKKHGLQELQLEWIGGDYDDSRNPRDEMQVLNLLKPPHQNLSSLSIIGYGGSELPTWIGDPTFSKLVNIKLSNCWNITSLLPLGHFSSLETLEIIGMRHLEKWTHSSNDLNEEAAALRFPKLHRFIISDCPKLVEKFPGCFPSLQKLYVDKCQEAIIRNMSGLTSLTILEIKDIAGLVSLDATRIQDLVDLQYININSCSELMYLWKDETNLQKLASLKRLVIKRCRQMVSLAVGEEGQLPCNLQVLYIQYCSNLEKLANGLHQLTYLRDLKIVKCDKLKSFSTTGVLCSLRHLQIYFCASLESALEGIIKMSQLEELTIMGCPSLNFSSNKQFPDSLKTLWIADCDWLKTLRLASPNDLSHLTSLWIRSCHQLECFPETELALHALTSFYIANCEKLKALPNGLHKLTSLQILRLSDCGGVESFPEGGLPPNLNELEITNCKNFRQPIAEWGLLTLSSLSILTIGGTTSSEMLDSFSDNDGRSLLPTSITHLHISDFQNLKSISFQNFTSLLSLTINSCPKLLFLPEKHFPPTFSELRINRCPGLKEWCLKHKRDLGSIISHIPSLQLYDNEDHHVLPVVHLPMIEGSSPCLIL